MKSGPRGASQSHRQGTLEQVSWGGAVAEKHCKLEQNTSGSGILLASGRTRSFGGEEVVSMDILLRMVRKGKEEIEQ